ncbi:MAG: transpeptidase family protein [candidate division Zixibacteria bacterium]|nr:transpeptidase family protein [candidate division Zixibacteria bacterium]
MMSDRVIGKFESKVLLLKIAFAIIFIVFVGRLIWLQVFQRQQFLEAALNQQNMTIEIQAKRGTIYDRYNRVLAQDIDSYSYYCVPRKITDKVGFARTLSSILGDKDWLNKFANHPKFLWVARKTTPEIQAKLDNCGLDTLYRTIEPRRVYPWGDLALSLIGRVDIDNIGLSGLEKYYQKELCGQNGKLLLTRDARGRSYQFLEKPVVQPVNGASIVISIDLDLQQIVEQELAAAIEENNAKYGLAIFENVATGEILACASLDSTGAPDRRNRPICDQYEPGSTFKVIAVGAALESGLFNPATIVFVENGKYRVDDRIIRDDHSYSNLSVEDIVVYSSNIGAAKLGLKLGDKLIYKMIKQSGFSMPLGIDFPGEASGSIDKLGWRQHYLANVCFGHGIAATPLQMMALYGAIASGGQLYRPYFGKEVIYDDGHREPLNHVQPIRNIMLPETALTISRFLREVVVRGTATKADSAAVTIAGKTGTALKISENGGYDHGKSRASFIGYFPANMPQVAGIVIFDEPKKSKYGGEVSAPVFRAIAERYSMIPTKLSSLYQSGGIIENRVLPPKNQPGRKPINDFAAKAQTVAYTVEQGGVPDFKGLTIRRALMLARNSGYECDFEGSGIVIEQFPAPGELAQPGITIKLRCASSELSSSK